MNRKLDLILAWIRFLSFSFKLILILSLIIYISINLTEVFIGFLTGILILFEIKMVSLLLTDLIKLYKKPKPKNSYSESMKILENSYKNWLKKKEGDNNDN